MTVTPITAAPSAASRYRTYLATAPNHKIHFRMAWQGQQAQCDRSITVVRDLAELNPDGGLDHLITAVIGKGLSPALLCKHCFAARTRAAITAQYPIRLAEAGDITRYAIVDATDDHGTHRLQVRAVRPHPTTPIAYLVPIGQVDAPTAGGHWWPLDNTVTMVPADQLTGQTP